MHTRDIHMSINLASLLDALLAGWLWTPRLHNVQAGQSLWYGLCNV